MDSESKKKNLMRKHFTNHFYTNKEQDLFSSPQSKALQVLSSKLIFLILQHNIRRWKYKRSNFFFQDRLKLCTYNKCMLSSNCRTTSRISSTKLCGSRPTPKKILALLPISFLSQKKLSASRIKLSSVMNLYIIKFDGRKKIHHYRGWIRTHHHFWYLSNIMFRAWKKLASKFEQWFKVRLT